jgi:hypothetical protein
MFNNIVGAGAVRTGAGTTSRYGSDSDQMMRLYAGSATLEETAAFCDLFKIYQCQISALEPEPHHVMAPSPSKR